MTETRQHSEDPRIARTRRSALEATLELAADSGLQACTFESVSERSGVARSTLYRHWNNISELVMDALKSQDVEWAAPDTGNLRDDMLVAMLGLGQGLEGSTWGAMIPQLMAAASIDPDMRNIQRKDSEYFLSFYVQIIERARKRGEVADETDPTHAALLFSAPIFYRHLLARQPVDAGWITSHVDKTVALLSSPDRLAAST